MKPEPEPPRAVLRRRQVLAGVWLAGLSGAAVWLTPRSDAASVPESALDALTPVRLGPWRAISGAQDVVPQTLADTGDADRTLLRSFVAPGQPNVMTASSYHAAESRDVKVHRPEVCYRSSGFDLSDLRDVDLALGEGVVLPARAFSAVRGSRVEQVLYWSRVAAAFPRDLTEQRLAMLSYGLRGRAADGLLMRFSLIGPATPQRLAVLSDFARLLFASVSPEARRMMVGALAISGGAAKA